MRSRWLDGALLLLVVAGGAALRWVHLGTPSLWWDELVEIAMAQAGGIGDVLRVVRHGVPHGSGNAGAMPLDYVLLHAWLAAAPPPHPQGLEVYFRFPAFVWSVGALAAMAAFGRRHLGRDVGLVATLLLAVSIPHVLYTAEARWYALLVLVTVAHLWAFARLLEVPAATGRWLVWLACAAAGVLTALLSVIPLAAELAVVAVRARQAPRAIGAVVASGTLLALLVAWLAAPALGVSYARPEAARPGAFRIATLVLGFLAWDQPLLLAALALALPLGWWTAWPDPRTRSIVVALALSFAAIPLVTALAHLKAYYVHPRHVLFLLPAFVVLAAVGIVGACRLIVGQRWALVAAVALVVATQAPTVARYLAEPDPFFARTKTLRDVRAVVEALPAPPAGARWFVLAERQSVPNAVLARYLRWWGFEDRVVLRGTRDVGQALRLLAEPSLPIERLAVGPLATIPVGLTDELRALLGIAADTSPPAPPLAGATVVTWDARPAAHGLVHRVLWGAATFERAR